MNKRMTTEEYLKWYPQAQAQSRGIDIHTFNTQLGYIVNSIGLLEAWKGREDKIEKIAYYEDLYDKAMREVQRLLKENALKIINKNN